MAPSKPSSKPSKGGPKGQKSKGSSGPSSKLRKPSKPSKPLKPTGISKPSQVKTKRSVGPIKKKKRVYTDKELGIPALNMITPAGVEKPRGKKKGKVFVDDQHSMMTILALVNAEKEGQIESKMMKARQLEEIREARRQEAEARQAEKRSRFEDTKDTLRKGGRSRRPEKSSNVDDLTKPYRSPKEPRKRVSFG